MKNTEKKNITATKDLAFLVIQNLKKKVVHQVKKKCFFQIFYQKENVQLFSFRSLKELCWFSSIIVIKLAVLQLDYFESSKSLRCALCSV